jgi:hypothetical protein
VPELVDEDEHAQQRHDGGRPEQQVHVGALGVAVTAAIAIMASP